MKYCLLVLCLLAGLTTGLVVSSMASSNGLVTTDHTPPIIIDGDPSDWTGINSATNDWNISDGEGIWNDTYFDDTGNGSYIYPNGTHTGPPIPDSAGGPDGYAYAYTGYPHGGMVDLREFRVTGNDTCLFMMFRIENMGSQAIACEYNAPGGTHVPSDPRFPYVNATGFGKILIQVYVSKDPDATVGRTNATMWGNFNLSSPWDFVVDVAGDVTWSSTYPLGYPRVEFANGTVHHLNDTVDSSAPLQPKRAIYTQGDCNIYPACIEIAVPKTIIGDFDLQTWRFWVVIGGLDEGRWRQVWSTSWAVNMGWPANFRFVGGEGEDPGGTVYGIGNDPNIIDMAFIGSTAEQEALLNEFQTTNFTVVNAYKDITFEDNVVVPWTPLYSLLVIVPILLVILAYIRKPKLNRTVKHH